MSLVAKATIQIQKSPEAVFEGMVNPDHMTQYFIAESSGRMETGMELIWKFPEFQDECLIKNIRVDLNKSVEFVWDPETIVRIQLEAKPDGSTVVRVSESGKTFTEENLKWLVGNTEGWANFLACMKAYLEYGIHLRKGAFEFMRQK